MYYPTETSAWHAHLRSQNALRIGAPPSNVRIFKIIDGKETLVRTDPPLDYNDVLKINNQLYSRKNKRG